MTNSSLRALWRFFLASYVLHCALAFVACLLTWWTVAYFDTAHHAADVRSEPIWWLAMRAVEEQLAEPFYYIFLVPVFTVALFWWSRVSRLAYLALTMLVLLVLVFGGADDHNVSIAVLGHNMVVGFIAAIHFVIAGTLRLWRRREP
ncbi:hypothetical protein [Massilia genomosp. 1]|uniref:VanZ family protein n=1 Tax=Massilia genomosp. 1 TaxID=2609280 RepID=A0ABX0N374_9BURK|nr:hypothetical protein [Massilia genomosp. 1]NHZ66322.1 hypothetical protein [Massilia genomosp. 1]